MYDKSLNAEVEERLCNQKYKTIIPFVKLYMDTHNLTSMEDLYNIVRLFGQHAYIHCRYDNNILLSAIRYADRIGYTGAVDSTGYNDVEAKNALEKLNIICDIKFEDIDEFIDYAVKSYIATDIIINPNKDFIDILLQKIHIATNLGLL